MDTLTGREDRDELRALLLLDRLPEVAGFDGTGVGPQHSGTFLIAPTMEYLEEAYADAKAGRPARSPPAARSMCSA